MPLDVDQYNIRRTYRNRNAVLGVYKTQRNELGNNIGSQFIPKQKLAYKLASLTQTDIAFYGETLNRVSRKLEIPPSPIIRDNKDTLYVKIVDDIYNISQVDTTNNNRWYVYLEKTTKGGLIDNG